MSSRVRRPGERPGSEPPEPDPGAHEPAFAFASLLFDGTARPDRRRPDDLAFVTDLNLDQIVDAAAADCEDRELVTELLYEPVHDVDTLLYRHEVFRDLEDPDLFEKITSGTGDLRTTRTRLAQLDKVHDGYQKQAWFLDAAATYCDALRAVAGTLSSARIESRGLRAFRDFLSAHVAGSTFAALTSDTQECKEILGRISYNVRVRGSHVEVSRYDGEADYSAEVVSTFERFKQGAVKSYLVRYRSWPALGHVGSWILERVARLFPEEFEQLDQYCRRHAGFFDATVRRFETDVQFYLAYLGFLRPLRATGLEFCYPDLDTTSKGVSATETFDLALADKLVRSGAPVVRNDFRLEGAERIFVVSGPNQGGKTTFARSFGQLHHLASVGCPVPGRSARLFVFDRLFTHFEREEDLDSQGGKLENDLIRIGAVLGAATSDSIVIMNEIFTSTTLHDARFLGQKLLTKVIELDLLCVYVTFVDELASLDESIVSMVSTIVPDDPSQRTYKVVRGPADGLAYALAVADKHGVTYERLRGRVVR